MSNADVPSVTSPKINTNVYFFLTVGLWSIHRKGMGKKVVVMRLLKTRFDRFSLQMIYFSFNRSILEYGDVIWDNLSQVLKDQLDKVQNYCYRLF